jgi:hypothetical protein
MTFTAVYDQTDRVRIVGGSPEIQERRYTLTISSDGVRTIQRLESRSDSQGVTKTFIFDGKNQVFVEGTYPNPTTPRNVVMQTRYESLTNPLRPMLEFGGVPFADLIKTSRVKPVSVEQSTDYGAIDVYTADFGTDIAVVYSGMFRLTQKEPRRIVASEEKSAYGKTKFRNVFSCKGLRTAGDISLPKISDVASYKESSQEMLLGSAHFVLKSLSDKPLPDRNFQIILPPGSRVRDQKSQNVWRVDSDGKLALEPAPEKAISR